MLYFYDDPGGNWQLYRAQSLGKTFPNPFLRIWPWPHWTAGKAVYAIEGWNVAYAHCVKSKLGLKCGLLCLLKVTPMPWGQSQDKGEVPERRKRSPYGTPCIFISSAWMRTSQGCSCLGGTGDSSVGLQMCLLEFRPFILWLLKNPSGKTLCKPLIYWSTMGLLAAFPKERSVEEMKG